MIRKSCLPNGVRVVMEEIPFVRSVSIGVWIATGSRDERADESGMSHFLEHMFFKGTSKHNARQLAEVFDGIGGQVNAFTTKEYTCFHAKVLDEHADIALNTLAEMLFDSQFDPEEMERERRVVIEEIKMYEDNPEEAVHDLILERAYPDHALGVNILGTEESLLSFTREDLMQYIKARYTPDHMVISVSGHIDSAAMLQMVTTLFGDAVGTGIDLVHGTPVFQPGHLYRERPIEQSHVCMAYSGFRYDHPDTYALVLLNNILGSSSSSRLFQEIREERGMAYSVFSYHSAFRDAGMFSIYFGCSPQQNEAVMELVDAIIDDVRKNGVTPEELVKAKNQVKGSLVLSLESTSSRMSRIGKNELLLRREVDLDETVREIERVTQEDVLRTAQQIFTGSRAVVGMGPGVHGSSA